MKAISKIMVENLPLSAQSGKNALAWKGSSNASWHTGLTQQRLGLAARVN